MSLFGASTLNSTSVCTFKAPFDTWLTGPTALTVIGLRTFEELTSDGKDILAEFYTPNGLAASDYTTDITNNEVIVTLKQANGKLFNIPSSYVIVDTTKILMSYNQVLLSVNLGLIANNYDLTLIKQSVANACSDYLGVAPTVTEIIGPVVDGSFLTDAQAAALETIRQAAVANRETDYAKVQRLTAQLANVLALNATLTTLCKDHGLLT